MIYLITAIVSHSHWLSNYLAVYLYTLFLYFIFYILIFSFAMRTNFVIGETKKSLNYFKWKYLFVDNINLFTIKTFYKTILYYTVIISSNILIYAASNLANIFDYSSIFRKFCQYIRQNEKLRSWRWQWLQRDTSISMWLFCNIVLCWKN